MVFPSGLEVAYSTITIVTLFASTYFLLQILKPQGFTDIILSAYCLITAQIVVIGYVLSFLHRIATIESWAFAGLIAACACAIVVALVLQRVPLKPNFPLKPKKPLFFKHASRFERILLIPLVITALVIGMIHLVVIVSTAPGNWDSMTYHLARVAYYFQHNSLASFDANYWAQTVHPKNSAILLLFSYLLSGGNENLTQLVQYIAYWIAVISVYGISRKTGNSSTRSLFAGLVSALLINWLMEAPTTQNDMLLTAFGGSAVFFLFSFRDQYRRRYIILSSLCLGLAVGTKSSALLMLPPFFLVGIFVFRKMISRERSRSVLVWVLSLVGAIIFAIPAGYGENFVLYGHPIGPENVRKEHSFEGRPLATVARQGTLNLSRYGLDFLSLDGIPSGPVANKMQLLLRTTPRRIFDLLGITLEDNEATRSPFELYRVPSANEDTSYWGVFGFALIWPVVLISVLGFSSTQEAKILSLGAILFFVIQAYAGSYDPWRGRYFVLCAVFAVPAIAVYLEPASRIIRGYFLIVTIAGCYSAFSSVLFKANSPLVNTVSETEYTPSLFSLSREEQLTRNRILYTKPVVEFEQNVPANATVAVFLRENSYEYPLFGRHLTRRIIPINSFSLGMLPMPAQADYLLYDRTFPDSSSTDLFLGEDWYLRPLHSLNPQEK